MTCPAYSEYKIQESSSSDENPSTSVKKGERGISSLIDHEQYCHIPPAEKSVPKEYDVTTQNSSPITNQPKGNHVLADGSPKGEDVNKMSPSLGAHENLAANIEQTSIKGRHITTTDHREHPNTNDVLTSAKSPKYTLGDRHPLPVSSPEYPEEYKAGQFLNANLLDVSLDKKSSDKSPSSLGTEDHQAENDPEWSKQHHGQRKLEEHLVKAPNMSHGEESCTRWEENDSWRSYEGEGARLKEKIKTTVGTHQDDHNDATPATRQCRYVSYA